MWWFVIVKIHAHNKARTVKDQCGRRDLTFVIGNQVFVLTDMLGSRYIGHVV